MQRDCGKIKTMNILIANDDGIKSEGIAKLTEALHREGGATVFVCAPEGQRSAASHSISIMKPIKVREISFSNAEIAFETSGTPADCVKLGIMILEKRGITIDAVYSGINHGANLGTDIIYSGTVGAALEGNICGIPSVAVSVDKHKASHFDFACELAVEALKKAVPYMDGNLTLNINTPNLPPEKIKGVKYAPAGAREYKDDLILMAQDSDGDVYEYGGPPIVYDGEAADSDVIAIQQGYASITPLRRNFTDNSMLGTLEHWRIGK